MKRSIKIIILSLAFIATLSFYSFAQKPMPERAFEVKSNYEEASIQQDNKRISLESGLPLAIYNPDFFLNPDTPEQMGLQYLKDNKSLLGLTDLDIQNLQLHAVRQGPSGTTVRFRQLLNGLAVNKAELTISINNKNVVTFLSNSFRYNLQINDFEAAIPPETARQVVLEKLNNPESYTESKFELKIFNQRNLTKLIYQIIIITENPLGEWEAFIDAETGEILKLEYVAFYYHNHHEALKPGLPPPDFHFFMLVDGTADVFDPDPLSTANAVYGNTGFTDNSDNTSIQLDGELLLRTLPDLSYDGTNYSLAGPWAEIKDFESPYRGLFSQTSSYWNYDRQDNAFEAANTYYHVDASMRYLNVDLGLSIKPDEYPGGVQFDPHGLNGADNSHYLGSTQRIAFGEGGVDDAEDSDVIHHELGHGLHDWVTNGGLSQVNGLSEGCGDYWAASYNRHLGHWDPTDDQNDWVFIWDGHNPFWNGRVVDYSALYPGGLTGSIHTDGQIWSTCMIKVWDQLGRTQTDKAFWEGLADTNGSTNQNDAANAVYQAAIDMGYTYSELAAMHDQMTNTGYMLPLLPLPVELSSFTATKVSESVELSWITSSEVNNDYFSVEKSADGYRFEVIAIVEAGGNPTEIQKYAYPDKTPFSGTNYYRLQQTDRDGKSNYSQVISVDFSSHPDFILYPNPVKQDLYIQSEILEKQNVQFSIYDFTGNEVSRLTNSQSSGHILSIDASRLPAGLYSLKFNVGGELVVKSFFKE